MLNRELLNVIVSAPECYCISSSKLIHGCPRSSCAHAQVPSKNAHLPYEPAGGGRRGGFGSGSGGNEGGNDFEGAGGMGMGGMGGGGGEGGSKKDKGKDSEINADISTMEIDEVSV